MNKRPAPDSVPSQQPAELPAEEGQRLRESEARYRGLFEHMAEGYAYCRMIFENGEPQDFVYLVVNAAFETLTGLRNVTGKSVSDVIPHIRETDPQLFSTYARVAMTGQAEKFEVFVQALKMWFSISVYSPEKGYFVAVFDVITERKKAEAALRESEQKFRGLFTWMGEAVQLCELVIDEVGAPTDVILIDVNPAYEQQTGLSREKVIGRRIKELLPVVEPVWLERYGEVIRTGKPTHFEEYNASVGRWFDVYASPMTGRRFAVVFSDITERKWAEAEQADIEIQTRQLKKDESLVRMAGAVAHHFNNHLQAISGSIELAMDHLSPGAERIAYTCLTDAMGATRRAAAVSRQMQAYLGETAGRKTPIDLSEVCRQNIAPLQRDMPGVLEADFVGPGPVIHANASQIREVLINLITNAWEAIGHKDGAIRMSVSQRSAAEITSRYHRPVEWQPELTDYACLEVSDIWLRDRRCGYGEPFRPVLFTKIRGTGFGFGRGVGGRADP